MPELPEVETTVRDLNRRIKGLKIQDIWTDWAKMVKNPKGFNDFKKQIIGEKIRKIERRGKNILFRLNNKTLLIHQKLTGHLLVGKWKLKSREWKPVSNSFLKEKVNQYIHLMLWLSNGKMLALSDLRKFGKVLVINNSGLENLEDIKNLGPEPLDKKFTFNKFKEIFKKLASTRRGGGKIKQVLMNQNIIAGIGNIYSDEILFEARIHPLKEIQKLEDNDLRRVYQAMKKILHRAIVLRGDSMSDYRDTAGKKGRYQEVQKVYQREGERCHRCKTIIKRIKIGGRSAHFCPNCQKL